MADIILLALVMLVGILVLNVSINMIVKVLLKSARLFRVVFILFGILFLMAVYIAPESTSYVINTVYESILALFEKLVDFLSPSAQNLLKN